MYERINGQWVSMKSLDAVLPALEILGWEDALEFQPFAPEV